LAAPRSSSSAYQERRLFHAVSSGIRHRGTPVEYEPSNLPDRKTMGVEAVEIVALPALLT
jgi:hypothetical protein